jgi:hypothetical protein
MSITIASFTIAKFLEIPSKNVTSKANYCRPEAYALTAFLPILRALP